MKAPLASGANGPPDRSVAQRVHSHHANAGSGPRQGAPFEEDLGPPLVQRKAHRLDSAQSKRVAQLQAIANARTMHLDVRPRLPSSVVQRLKLSGQFGLDPGTHAALIAKIDAFHEQRRKLGDEELSASQQDSFEDLLKDIRRTAEDLGGPADAVADDASEDLEFLATRGRLRPVPGDGAAAAAATTTSAAATASASATSTGHLPVPSIHALPSGAASAAAAVHAAPPDEISDLSVWAPNAVVGASDATSVRQLSEQIAKALGADLRLVTEGAVALWRAGELPASFPEALRLLRAPIRLCERIASIAASGIKSRAELATPSGGAATAAAASASASAPTVAPASVQSSSDINTATKTHFFDIQHGRNASRRYPETYPRPGFSSASVASERTADRLQTAHWAIRLALDGHRDALAIMQRFQAARGDTGALRTFVSAVAADADLSRALGEHIRNAPSDSPEKRFLRLLLSGRSHYTAMFASTGAALTSSSVGGLVGRPDFAPDVRELTSSSSLGAAALTHLIVPEVMRIFDGFLSAHFHGTIIYVPTVSVPAFTYFDAEVRGRVAAGRVLVPDYDHAINQLAAAGKPVLTHITRGPAQ